MIINFKVRGINLGVYKLTQISTLIIIIIKKHAHQNTFFQCDVMSQIMVIQNPFCLGYGYYESITI